jgi:hypothetical protein
MDEKSHDELLADLQAAVDAVFKQDIPEDIFVPTEATKDVVTSQTPPAVNVEPKQYP